MQKELQLVFIFGKIFWYKQLLGWFEVEDYFFFSKFLNLGIWHRCYFLTQYVTQTMVLIWVTVGNIRADTHIDTVCNHYKHVCYWYFPGWISLLVYRVFLLQKYVCEFKKN